MKKTEAQAALPGSHSEREPPESIPNSEVKTLSADDSVGPPHVKVGHRQALIIGIIGIGGISIPDPSPPTPHPSIKPGQSTSPDYS